MELLKNIPVNYSGELHEVKLINFSIEKEEVLDKVPQPLKVWDYNGRALISLVNVQLRDMKMSIAPLKFDYRHVAFRLLLDDSKYNKKPTGIYFLKSFTNSPLIVVGGKLMTDFNLSFASIQNEGNSFELKQGNHFLHLATGHPKLMIIC